MRKLLLLSFAFLFISCENKSDNIVLPTEPVLSFNEVDEFEIMAKRNKPNTVRFDAGPVSDASFLPGDELFETDNFGRAESKGYNIGWSTTNNSMDMMVGGVNLTEIIGVYYGRKRGKLSSLQAFFFADDGKRYSTEIVKFTEPFSVSEVDFELHIHIDNVEVYGHKATGSGEKQFGPSIGEISIADIDYQVR